MGRKSEEMTDAQVEKARASLAAWRKTQHEAAVRYAKRSHRRRNDGPWRQQCLDLYGPRCKACGSTEVEIDHIIPRSQGGASDVENGLVLCGQWSPTVPGGHHGLKTAGRLLIDPAWLTAEQRAYLALQGWVDWDRYGRPFGRGFKHFGPIK